MLDFIYLNEYIPLMRKNRLNIIDDMAISRLKPEPTGTLTDRSHAEWIRTLRGYLRMTQAELAKRSDISQPHLAGIESGKIDPQVSTLRRIYQGLSCDLVVEPRPRKPLEEMLRGQARSLALKRLKHTMGTMALENQAPGEEVFRQLLEKRTDQILKDDRERIWQAWQKTDE
ncbi:MAG TPA: helix-turn-helix domain-containing protein [Nitrospiraceae bacterium]|jgi:predicted DNA-binding mobile mystery protein A|nr:helix-turn-helix domain-containing protein [Nitrospiraceae bacterium]